MLTIENLNQYYGGSHILRNISLQARPGRVTAVLGRNGVGKTTLLRTLMGLVPARSGTVRFKERDLTRMAPYDRVRAGLAYVPQGREIFPRLTVRENLLMGLASQPPGSQIPERVFDLFPVLRQMLTRRGGDLSGGQQQQLAIGRALCCDPRLLILDEPTEGIQPSIIKDIARTLNEIRKMRDITIIVSEQVLSFALDVADRLLVIEGGRLVHESLRSNTDTARIKEFLSV